MRRFGCDVGNEVVRVLWIVSESSNSSLLRLFFVNFVFLYIAHLYIYIYKLIESLIISELRIRFEREERRKKCDETSFD